MPKKMKEKDGIIDTSFGPQFGDRAVWDMESPDHECDCPGPPPKFYLPPPPRPFSVLSSECSDNSISDFETCEAVPVIDAEYHYSPAIPSFAILLIVAVAVVVFLLIGTILVVLRKRKMQHLLPRKSSPANHCDAATANGVVYEDLTNIQPRSLPPHCPPTQTTLPSIEMIDVTSYPDHRMFSPPFICPSSPVPDSYNSQDLFNPVYEELSNGSGERGETDSEELPQVPSSEDEFAEDELSLGGDIENHQEPERKSENSSLQGSTGNDLCRDVDSSDADDRSKFLGNPGKNFSLPPEYRDKRKKVSRETHFLNSGRRPRSLDRRRGWRKKPPPLPIVTPPLDYSEFHEGLLLKTILQLYPNMTGVNSPYSREPPYVNDSSSTTNQYESVPALTQIHSHRPKQEIFTTFRAIQGSGKNQSQDSSFGSDSGYSNNTSGGKTSSRSRKDFRVSNHSDPVLS